VAAFTNLIVAGILSTVLFSIGHSYQGMTGVIKTGMIGIIFLAVYWASGSLWPAITLHIVQDFFGGVAGYMSLSMQGPAVNASIKKSG
jgi:membrane protease YdiL (CAAX protease family)